MKFAFIDTDNEKTRTVHANDAEEAIDVVTYHLRVLGCSSLDGMDYNEARKYVASGGNGGNEFLIHATDDSVWSSSTPEVSRFLDSRKTRVDRLYEEELNLGLPVSHS